jgi:hypothetical protein
MNRSLITKAIAIAAIFVLIGIQSKARPYDTGIGLRGGFPWGTGISVKHFLDGANAVEGVLTFGWGGVGITGFYQMHAPIPDAPDFKWYYGAGAHVAFHDENNGPFDNSTMVLGVDGIVGAEFIFPAFPISISLDLIPHINFIPKLSPGISMGLSIRYIF